MLKNAGRQMGSNRLGGILSRRRFESPRERADHARRRLAVLGARLVGRDVTGALVEFARVMMMAVRGPGRFGAPLRWLIDNDQAAYWDGPCRHEQDGKTDGNRSSADVHLVLRYHIAATWNVRAC